MNGYNKFYKKNNNGSVKSGAPYLFLLNISNENLKKLKTYFFLEGHVFRDGHDFYDADFSLNNLKETSTVENKVSLKFLNSEDNLKKVLNENLGKTKVVYQFFVTEPLDIIYDIKVINIQIKNIQDINYII